MNVNVIQALVEGKIKIKKTYCVWGGVNPTRRGAYEQTFFPLAQNFFPFSNPFPFEPKETKISEDNFSRILIVFDSFS